MYPNIWIDILHIWIRTLPSIALHVTDKRWSVTGTVPPRIIYSSQNRYETSDVMTKIYHLKISYRGDKKQRSMFGVRRAASECGGPSALLSGELHEADREVPLAPRRGHAPAAMQGVGIFARRSVLCLVHAIEGHGVKHCELELHDAWLAITSHVSTTAGVK